MLMLGNSHVIEKNKTNPYKEGYILRHFVKNNSFIFVSDTSLFGGNRNDSIESFSVFTLYSIDDKYLPVSNKGKYMPFKYYRGIDSIPQEAYFAKARVYFSLVDSNEVLDIVDSIQINGYFYNFIYSYGAFPDSIKYLNR